MVLELQQDSLPVGRLPLFLGLQAWSLAALLYGALAEQGCAWTEQRWLCGFKFGGLGGVAII